ncbi:MAG: glycosyltransferase family 39 protein [Chloroflexota bacterium]
MSNSDSLHVPAATAGPVSNADRSARSDLGFWCFFVGLIVVTCAAAFVRLFNLMAFQVHTDEASWVLWTDTMDPRRIETLWTTFKADGRTPLYSWAVWGSRQLPIEPLLAARLVSAGAGILTTGATLVLGVQLFGRWPALAGAALYAVSSYAVFFERIANDDGLATLLGMLGVICAVAATQRSSFPLAMCSGALAFLSFLAKPTGALFLAAPVMASVLLARDRRGWLCASLAIAAAIGCYGMLALAAGSMLELMDRNRNVHALPIQEMLKFPLDRWTANAQRLSGAWVGYQGWPLFVLAVLGIVVPIGTFRARLFTLALAVLPLGFFTILGGVLFSRYLLLGTPSLCLLAGVGAVGVGTLASRWGEHLRVRVALSGGLMVLGAGGGFALLISVISQPAQAPLPSPDRDYIEGVASGWGVHEVAEILRSEAARGRVMLLKRSGPFYPEIAVMYELRDMSNVRVRDERLLRFDDPSLADVVRWRQRDEPVYFFVNACCWDPGTADAEDWRTRRVMAEVPGVQRVAAIDRPGERSRLVLFRL